MPSGYADDVRDRPHPTYHPAWWRRCRNHALLARAGSPSAWAAGENLNEQCVIGWEWPHSEVRHDMMERAGRDHPGDGYGDEITWRRYEDSTGKA